MNHVELQALVIKQGERLGELEASLNTDPVNGAFQVERNKHLTDLIETLTARVEDLAEKLSELRDRPDLTARIEKIETLVLARNASAATKRNMTDEDALRVLTGDLRDLSHKEAAEKIALTYAQVYSCRLEFTFKHVHKDLRDNVKEWKNPWSK